MVAVPVPPIELHVRDADLLEVAEQFPNVAEGFQYARDVLSGVIVAGLDVRLACQRHERDLAAIGTDWPYTFVAARAERALRAMQLFREIKGPRSGKRLRLQPWQRFVYASIFGWVDKDTHTRRFSYAFIAVPRGNGKSTAAAPLALYMLALDGEGGAEVYAAAVTREQARIVFAMAQFMCRRDPEFRQRYGVTVHGHVITQESSASTFAPLSRDADALDGKNVHLAVLDELAKHKTREVHDVLLTGTGKRLQPLMMCITTAASNQTGIGYEVWRESQRLLRREIENERMFAIIYTIDEDDDWRDPNSWRKANPNWGVSVNPDTIATLCKRAENIASQQNAFKQKHLNVWTSAAVQWLSSIDWNACADASLEEASLAGEQCVAGLDLASKVDLAAYVKLFRRMIDGRWHYYAFPAFYLPLDVIRAQRNPNYETWHAKGLLRCSLVETATTDYTVIEADVSADHERYGFLDIAYDPYQAKMLAANLERSGIPVIEVRPTVPNFSPAMKELEALVLQRRFHHTGNEVLDWNINCVEAWSDHKDNVYPRKDKTDGQAKIDGAVALLMALARFMALDTEPQFDADAMIG
jgi:phage terminase large subunit-like protein